MEICSRHQGYMDEALRLRNLQGLFSPSQEETDLKVRLAMNEGLTLDNFDPRGLIVVGLEMQVRRVLKNMGELQRIRTLKTCMLCWLNEEHRLYCSEPRTCRFTYDGWVEPAADDVLELWRDLNC